MVVDRGAIAIVDREGCLASVRERVSPIGPVAEIQTRCPKPERMQAWFDQADKFTDSIAYAPMGGEDNAESESDALDNKLGDHLDMNTVSAKVLVSNGRALRVTNPADIEKLTAQVRALSDELAGAETVAPGPASPGGWQMLHVNGPAHVMFAGQPARGTFDARVSTNGQYKCEFITNIGGEAPITAMKSGWLKPTSAAHAIDVVLQPFAGGTDAEHGAFAAGTKSGNEQKTSTAATPAVLQLFGEVQEALGDACLPELELQNEGSGKSMSNTGTSL